MSTPDPLLHRERLLRIVARLIERTEADEAVWEKAAVANSWAIDLPPYRFRIAAAGDERLRYTLDMMGPAPETITTGPDNEWNDKLERLYRVGSESAARHTPDPLLDVEAKLGLDVAPSDSDASPS